LLYIGASKFLNIVELNIENCILKICGILSFGFYIIKTNALKRALF